MNKKIFVLFIILNLFIILFIYISLFFYQLGANVKSESWIEPMYQIKHKKAISIGNQNKIIIISGSNALFGIDSQLISDMLNKPILNLAVMGSLDTDFLYYKIKKYIKKNDIVVMPLEYHHYDRAGYSDWFVNNILVWGNDYFYNLDFLDKIKFIFSVNINRLILGIEAKVNGNIYNYPSDALEDLINIINTEGIKWRGYSYKSANLDGDINLDSINKVNDFIDYVPFDLIPSKHFLIVYNKIKKLVEENEGKLILTHPITFRNSKYDLNIESHQQRVEKFIQVMNTHNIVVECNPALFHLEQKYAFDTFYHSNKYGAMIRSENLVYCINESINGNQNISLTYNQSNDKRKKLELKYDEIFNKEFK